MLRLKADLHTHSGEDPCDDLRYSAEMLIDEAAKFNLEVLAITCHVRRIESPHLIEYARERGILLVPGAELMIEGKHVVALNPNAQHLAARTFADLRAAGKGDAVFIAPHPFYPEKACLGRKLIENIDLFDAVEYCCMYLAGINPNRRGVRVAKRYGLPMVGSSDTHSLPYSDSTHSILDVEEATVAGVLDAVRAGRVEVRTRPRSVKQMLKMVGTFVHENVRMWAGERD